MPLAALHLPPLEWLLQAGLAVALAAATAWVWGRLLRGIWALGFDRLRHLAWTVPPVRFLLLLGVWAAIVIPPWEAAGGEAFVPAAVVTALVTAWAFRSIQDVVGGLALAVTRPFHVGDQIATAEASGRVVALGLTRIRVWTSVGEVVDVPARALASQVVRVSRRPGGALPVEVRVPLPEGPAPDLLLEGLRDHALLSAYTDASSPVLVELVTAREARIAATPLHPDDADELRSDLAGRAAALSSEAGRGIPWPRRD